MKSCTKYILPVSLTLVLLTSTSCLSKKNPELVAAQAELAQLEQRQAKINYPISSYEYFVSHDGYPVTIGIYKDRALLSKATPASRVIICLSQQRGRLYVGDQVAADWPVSTGIPGRETPTGNFSVREKKRDYASNRYGKIYNSEGKCVNYDADAFNNAVPEGGRFVGSPMPCWLRLTGDGVGMHIGKVRAGRRLSHGCIRTPGEMARELYRILAVGSKVSVRQDIEPQYPCRDALIAGTEQHQNEKRIRALKEEIYKIQMREKEEKRG